MTSWSLNCSRMSSHSGVGGSSGIAENSQFVLCDSYWIRMPTIFAVFLQGRLDSQVCEAVRLRDAKVLEHLLGRANESVVHRVKTVSMYSAVGGFRGCSSISESRVAKACRRCSSFATRVRWWGGRIRQGGNVVGERIDNRRPRRGCNLALTFLGASDAGDE